jgi:hypothetical protein
MMVKLLLNVGMVIAAILFLRAQQPIVAGTPASAIGYFNRTTATGCPAGWSELTAARGAALVGLPNAGTKGTIVGAPLTDQENRHHNHSLSTHSHTYSGTSGASTSNVNVSDTGENHDANVPGHAHGWSNTSSTISTDLTGADSVMIAPYMQLLFCVKS